jgi:hypothetical protein
MNPLNQPTQPTEAHRKLWTSLYNLAHREIFEDYAESSEGPATQLIADSEARAVEAATVQLRSELNYAKASETLYHDEGTAAIAALTVERERVRVLTEHSVGALMVARSWQMVWGDKLSPDSVSIFTKHEQAFLAALAATAQEGAK